MIKAKANNHPLLFSIGINHKTAPLEIREKMVVSDERLPLLLDKFKGILDECMVISTCNRTELYGVTNGSGLDSDMIKQMMIDFNNVSAYVGIEHFYEHLLGRAADQLFKVTSSIDSMVVGDSQVMSQVKRSYSIAFENSSTKKIINQLVQKALHAAKRVKSETRLFEGAFSISYASIELAAKIFGQLNDKTALVIGAGETAELTVDNLIKKRIKKVYVTNRTNSNAENLLAKFKNYGKFAGEVLNFESFKEKLDEVDIIISSTGANSYVLNYDEFKNVAKKRRGEPMLIIDIAVPRDIDPKIDSIGNVFLKNIDDLNSIVDTNYEKRIAVIPDVKNIILDEVLEFLIWYYTIPILPSIKHIQDNLNGDAKTKISELRRFLTENITEFHKKTLEANPDFNDELNRHFELLSSLERMNIKNFSGIIDLCLKKL